MDVIIIRTCYFSSLRAAHEYYGAYGYKDIKASVAEKIKAGDIIIGRKPILKPGQKFAWNREGRGIITELCTKTKAQA